MTRILTRLGLLVGLLCGLVLTAAVVIGEETPPSGQMALAVNWGTGMNVVRPSLLLADVERGITGTLDRYLGDIRRVNDLDWSPDGRYLAFYGSRGDPALREIYVLDIETHTLYPQTALGGRAGSPVWSPDGTQIAFTSDYEGASAVYIIAFTTGAPAAPVRISDAGYDLDWTADGEALLMPDPQAESRGILRLDIATGERELIVGWPATSRPRISPDGAQLAFIAVRIPTRPRGTSTGLFLADAAGGSPEVPSLEGNDISGGSAPAWSPDSAYIAFATLDVQPTYFRTAIYAFAPASGDVLPLFDLPPYSRVHSIAWQPET